MEKEIGGVMNNKERIGMIDNQSFFQVLENKNNNIYIDPTEMKKDYAVDNFSIGMDKHRYSLVHIDAHYFIHNHQTGDIYNSKGALLGMGVYNTPFDYTEKLKVYIDICKQNNTNVKDINKSNKS